MKYITNNEIQQKAKELAHTITHCTPLDVTVALYGVPRGGIPAAYAVQAQLAKINISSYLTEVAEEADFIIDDLIDSGSTRERYSEEYNVPFLALFNKQEQKDYREWLVFPWENTDEGAAEDIPVRLIQYIGENVARGGLKETPRRFLKAWDHYTSGYKEDPEKILKVFEDGAENYDEMVMIRNCEVYSQCEHHLAPFFGVAHIAYIPDKKILGLSKIHRLVDVFSRRLQVQERLTSQIADALQKNLNPIGVGVVLECRHMCVESRGVAQRGTITTTSILKGALKNKESTRAEFFSLINSNKDASF